MQMIVLWLYDISKHNFNAINDFVSTLQVAYLDTQVYPNFKHTVQCTQSLGQPRTVEFATICSLFLENQPNISCAFKYCTVVNVPFSSLHIIIG